jgi:hypothetical protein
MADQRTSVPPSSSSTCISPNLEIYGEGSTETGTTGRRSRALAIRATPAQATLLKEEYKDSNTLTPEKAKILSEKTGLCVFFVVLPLYRPLTGLCNIDH